MTNFFPIHHAKEKAQKKKIDRYIPSRKIFSKSDITRFQFYNHLQDYNVFSSEYSENLFQTIFKENIPQNKQLKYDGKNFPIPILGNNYFTNNAYVSKQNSKVKNEREIPFFLRGKAKKMKKKKVPLYENRSPSLAMRMNSMKENDVVSVVRDEDVDMDVFGMNGNSLKLNTLSMRSQSSSSSSKKEESGFDGTSFLVLEAPDISQDFYLNLLDWNKCDQMCVGLGEKCYIWNARSCEVLGLASYGISRSFGEFSERFFQDVYISSVKFQETNNVLSVGKSNGEIDIFDITKASHVCTIFGGRNNSHQSRCASMDWNYNILTIGGRDGRLVNYDIRVKNGIVMSVKNAHKRGDICGIKWNLFRRDVLATGGNDNLVRIWDVRNFNIPRIVFAGHNAAVKAIDWDGSTCLTGGGRLDKRIIVWNSQDGKVIKSAKTDSQISGLFLSSNKNNGKKEIITSHGQPTNGLYLWDYKTLRTKSVFKGHVRRVLFLTQNPTNNVVVSASADETIRFFNVWKNDSEKKMKSGKDKKKKKRKRSQFKIYPDLIR